jgi:hypothetical protein
LQVWSPRHHAVFLAPYCGGRLLLSCSVWWCCSYGHNAKHDSYFEVGCQGRNRRVQQQPVKALPRASSKAEACTVMQGAQLPAAGRTFTQASRQRAEPRHHGQTAFSSCDSSQRQSAAKTGLERCGLYQSAEAAIAELRSSSLSTTASSSLTCSQTQGCPVTPTCSTVFRLLRRSCQWCQRSLLFNRTLLLMLLLLAGPAGAPFTRPGQVDLIPAVLPGHQCTYRLPQLPATRHSSPVI